MRGDVDGYVAEFHPAAPVFNIWYPEYRNVPAWRDRQRSDPARPRQAPPDLPGCATGTPAQPRSDPARRDQEVPGHPQPGGEHVRRLQRLQHGPRNVAEQLREVPASTWTPFRRRPSEVGRQDRPRGRLHPQADRGRDPDLILVSIGIFLMVRLLPGDIIDILFGGDLTAPRRSRSRRASSSV